MDRLLRRFASDAGVSSPSSSSHVAWSSSPLVELPLGCRELLQSMGVEAHEAALDFSATLAVLRYELAQRRAQPTLVTSTPGMSLAALEQDAEIVESLQTRQRRAASAVDEVREENRLIATATSSAPRSPSTSYIGSHPNPPLRASPSTSHIERPVPPVPKAHPSASSPVTSPHGSMISKTPPSPDSKSARAASPTRVQSALGGYVLSPQDPAGTFGAEPELPPPPVIIARPAASPLSSPGSNASRSRGPAWFNLVSQAKPSAGASPPPTKLPPPSSIPPPLNLSKLPPPPSPLSSPASSLSSSSPTPAPSSPHSVSTTPLSFSQPAASCTQSWADALSALSSEPLPSPSRSASASSSSSSRAKSSATLPSNILNALHTDEPWKHFPQNGRLGSGGSAEVFRSLPPGKPAMAVKAYAVKVPGGNPAHVEQVANELDVFLHCKHPTIVSFYGAYLWKERVYAVVELCDGGTLLSLYKNIALPEPAIAYCVGEVLSGLAYMHTNNRLHRDVKAENVLLMKTGEVKLADFGTAIELANAFEHNSSSSLPAVGTRYFMAPEMIRGDGYSSRADIWSTGCLLIELCNRQVPHAELRSLRALLRIASVGAAPLKHPSRFSSALNDALKQLVNFRWQERPSAVQALGLPFFSKRRAGRAALMGLISDSKTDELLP